MGVSFKVTPDDLNQVANMFRGHSDDANSIIAVLRGPYDVLRNGAWIGVGANRFFDEMDNLIFPGLQKVQGGLDELSQHSLKISQTASQYEQDILGKVRRG